MPHGPHEDRNGLDGDASVIDEGLSKARRTPAERFTPADNRLLIQLYNEGRPIAEIEAALRCAPGGLRFRLRELRKAGLLIHRQYVPHNRKMTPEREKLVRQLWPQPVSTLDILAGINAMPGGDIKCGSLLKFAKKAGLERHVDYRGSGPKMRRNAPNFLAPKPKPTPTTVAKVISDEEIRAMGFEPVVAMLHDIFAWGKANGVPPRKGESMGDRFRRIQERRAQFYLPPFQIHPASMSEARRLVKQASMAGGSSRNLTGGAVDASPVLLQEAA